MKHPLRFTALLVVIGWTLTAQAQEASPIDNAAWGLRFTPPAGWVQHQAPNGYLFVAPDQQGLLAVLPHQTSTLDALRAEARQGFYDEAGTVLQLQSQVDAFGENGLAATYTGWIEGSPARARVIGLVAPQGTGATILAAAAPEHYSDELAETAAAVARSVAFSAKPVAQAAQPQPAGAEEKEWQDFLQGCRLSYFNRYDSGYGGGGYSDETTIDLCPGYFTYGARSETVFNTTDPVSGNDPYLSSNQQGAGQWRVVRQGGQSVLQLQFHDGSERTHILGYEDGKTYLDGRRWLRTCNPNDSVVEARPQCQ